MDDLKERATKLLEKLDIEGKQKTVRNLEAESMKPDFWKNQKDAADKMKILTEIQKEISNAEKLQKLVESGQHEEAEKLLIELEVLLYLSGIYDSCGAILSVHSGQGGVEAMDWAAMLKRMYTRYVEKKGWSYEVIEETLGEEAGIKSAVIAVEGRFAYGYLKREAGVHRLVRLSPFSVCVKVMPRKRIPL